MIHSDDKRGFELVIAESKIGPIKSQFWRAGEEKELQNGRLFTCDFTIKTVWTILLTFLSG